jgi:hypothetical protein
LSAPLSSNPSTLRIGTGAGAGIERPNVALVHVFKQLITPTTTFSYQSPAPGLSSKLGAGTTTLCASTFAGRWA